MSSSWRGDADKIEKSPDHVNRQVETALRLNEEISQPPHHVGAQLLAFGQKENG
ncbi:hypothetical protein BH18VER2_BH18VER2_04730 [soil metagenome]